MSETLEILTHKPVEAPQVKQHVSSITNIVCSPKMKYIASWSPECKSVFRWPITKTKETKAELKFDKHFVDDSLDIKALIGVSDLNHIILRVEKGNSFENSYNFEIIDIVKRERQRLNAQDLKGEVVHHSGFFDNAYSEFCHEISFIENGDLIIIKGDPIYRLYIFNFNDKLQWKCKNNIELPKYYKCSVSPKGKLLALLEFPFVIIQWDLTTLKFEMKYILDWNLYHSKKSLQMCLSNDNTLLSVGETKIRTGHGDEYRKPALIAIYSVKDGILINKSVDKLDDTLNEGGLILDNMRFIGSKNNERLLFYFYVHGYAERQFSIINPYTLTIKDAELLFREIECYKRLKICTILFDHIIKVEKDHLSIQNLAEHDAWSNYTKNDDAQMNLHTSIQDNEFDSLFKNKSFEELIDSFYGEESYYKYLKDPEIDKCINETNLSNLQKYGKDLMNALLNPKKQLDDMNNKIIKQVFMVWLEKTLSEFERGNIYTFIGLISVITSLLTTLANYNRSNKFIERFLSQTAFLIPRNDYEDCINNISLSSHLEPCGAYPVDLYTTSYYKYGSLWIPKFSLIFKPLKFVYLIFFASYPKPTVKLMIPTINFATYSENYSTYKELIHPPEIPFNILYASNYYKWWNIKALINFKWNTYGKYYYYTIWAIYTIFMCCFVIVATISQNEISSFSQIFLLLITIFLGICFIIIEIRHFLYSPKFYMTDFWNLFDIVALSLPIIVSLTWLYEKTISVWIITISTLLLELKFLFFFRAINYFGNYFAIMIGVAQRIFTFLILLGIIIFAFAHSLHLLLRPTTEYSYNQPNYNNDVNNPWNLATRYKSITPDGVIGNDFLIETPDANTNLFSAFKTAIVAVYFMLTGDLSSVSSWNLNENWTLVALLVIFSFFTTIYLLNLFIGLLSTAIESTNNDESFLQLKREILSEIELFWMLPHQRRRKDWFPEIIYYEATIEELQKYVQKIQSENFDESSKPFIFPHIYKIAKLDAKTIDEKLNDLDRKFQDLIEDIKRLKSEN